MPSERVGIIGYGAYIPLKRIKTEYIVRARERKREDLDQFVEKVHNGLLLREKSVAGLTEDSITIATEAAMNAVDMAGIDPREIETVAAGSESKPYAVGTIARHVASFLGLGNQVYVADLEGACNSGMQSTAFIESQILSGRIKYGLAIGTDVAQAPVGDPLEYACGAGAGAFLLGKDQPVATIVDTAAYSTLTLDFWRRDGEPVPSHFGRTTVEAYIKHVIGAIEGMLLKHPEISLMDFDHITFHQPSGYMPLKTCKTLAQDKIPILDNPQLEERIRLTPEFIEERVRPWLRVLDTGNTYAAATLIATCDILDHAKPGEDILAVSYGSGAYTIATWLHVEDRILERRGRVPTVRDYVNRRHDISLESYKRIMRYKRGSVRTKLTQPKIVAQIEPYNGQMITFTLCNGCQRVFYPARDRCLEYDCKGPVEQHSLPVNARLLKVDKLPLKERLRSNFEFLKQGKVLIVDTSASRLSPGMELEALIRRLDDEGRAGLIIYGPTYRPVFRTKALAKKAEAAAVLAGSAKLH
jgi:hydroxymethylglutaryl-CoA synthase